MKRNNFLIVSFFLNGITEKVFVLFSGDDK